MNHLRYRRKSMTFLSLYDLETIKIVADSTKSIKKPKNDEKKYQVTERHRKNDCPITKTSVFFSLEHCRKNLVSSSYRMRSLSKYLNIYQLMIYWMVSTTWHLDSMIYVVFKNGFLIWRLQNTNSIIIVIINNCWYHRFTALNSAINTIV